MNTQLLSIKAKKIGVKLAGFRTQKGVSTDTLSLWTGIPKEEIEKIERGEATISLPMIELIALKLGLMTDTLISGEFGNLPLSQDNNGFNQHYAALRDRVIALLMRKNRLEQHKTVEEIASKCSVSPDLIEQYESGNKSIPWPVLECLCEDYQLPVNSLFSNITSSERSIKKDTAPLSESSILSTEMTQFVQNPANLPYLELAKKLSDLDASKLRSIAEGLLEITY
jgi:transcriptional regulator with XRE-family HTH domain